MKPKPNAQLQWSKTILVIIVASLLLFNFNRVSSPQATDDNTPLYAAFMYHFAKFTSWRGENGPKPGVVVGYLGNAVPAAFQKNLNGKTTPRGQISVKKITAAEAAKCHIVFIPLAKSAEASSIKSAIKNTLVVTEGSNVNAHISFVVVQKKLRFEMRKKLTEKNKLEISDQLTKMAILK